MDISSFFLALFAAACFAVFFVLSVSRLFHWIYGVGEFNQRAKAVWALSGICMLAALFLLGYSCRVLAP